MKLLSLKQAATEIGCSRQRVQQMIAEGKLKAEKLGSQWTIRQEDLPRRAGRPARKG